MKKVLMTMTLLLVLSMGMEAAAQKHRHSPRPQEELVDSTNKDAVEVYSDTTSAQTTTTQAVTWDDWDDDDSDLKEGFKDLARELGTTDMMAIFFILAVLFIIFVLAPVLIIVALFYFINKNRKQRMKLAQQAVEQGQPIPDQLLLESQPDASEEYKKGMRQFFVGVGLMFFLGFAAGEIGFGIGALVACIGLGKIAAAKLGKKKEL